MAGGRKPKRAGYRSEMAMVHFMAPLYKRNAMSGALGGEHAGDLRAFDKHNPIQRIEVKRRAKQKTLRKWLGQGDAQAVMLDPGFGDPPLVIMDAGVFKLMLVLLLEATKDMQP